VLGLFGLSVFSLLHLMQVFEFLFFSVYLLFYIIGAIGVFFIILQYKHTRGFIVERASLRWLVYALITGDVLFFIISIIPLIASFELIYKQFFYWIALLCVYVGVALGLKKYKLFKLELWALYSWVWMFGGLVVLGLAVLLMTVFNVNSVVALLFSDIHVHSYTMSFLIFFLTSALFSIAGFINAIYANSFDDISIVPTFILTPLTYLGGIFYSIDMLPEFWQNISLANPILYMISSFRYGMLGTSDTDPYLSIIIIIGFTIVLFSYAMHLLNKGVGIKQ